MAKPKFILPVVAPLEERTPHYQQSYNDECIETLRKIRRKTGIEAQDTEALYNAYVEDLDRQLAWQREQRIAAFLRVSTSGKVFNPLG